MANEEINRRMETISINFEREKKEIRKKSKVSYNLCVFVLWKISRTPQIERKEIAYSQIEGVRR